MKNMDHPSHKMDDIFRQRLQDVEVPPPAFVWAAVEQGLQKRRRKRVLLWLFTLLSTAATGMWLWQTNVQHKEIVGLNTNPQVVDKQDVAFESQAAAQTEETTDYSSTSTGADSPRQIGALNAEDKKYSALLGINSRKSDAATSASASSAQKNFNTKTPKNSRVTNTNTQTKPVSSPEITLENSAQPAHSAKKMGADAAGDADQLLTIPAINSVASIAAAEQAPTFKTFKPLTLRKKIQPKLCYDFAKHPSAWMVDVYAGPSLAQRNLTSRSDDEPYLQQRLATEKRSVAMNAGVRVSLMFNRNFLVRSGLNLDHITEEFEFIDPTSVVTTINQKYVNGQFVGVDTVVTYGENYLKTYNRYALLDVPLLLGVEMRSGRTGFNVNAGISANILFIKRGAVIDPNTQEPGRFGPGGSLSQSVFRTNLGVSAGASVQWYWHMTPYFRLFVEPSFRQVLRPVTLSSHPVEQRYSILGLRLGATKIL
jgi:hypothetical protein